MMGNTAPGPNGAPLRVMTLRTRARVRAEEYDRCHKDKTVTPPGRVVLTYRKK